MPYSALNSSGITKRRYPRVVVVAVVVADDDADDDALEDPLTPGMWKREEEEEAEGWAVEREALFGLLFVLLLLTLLVDLFTVLP